MLNMLSMYIRCYPREQQQPLSISPDVQSSLARDLSRLQAPYIINATHTIANGIKMVLLVAVRSNVPVLAINGGDVG
jgi:hypothetical protein